MTQAAVVNYGPQKHNVELREIERPTIGPDDVLLEVAAVGVCGSDLHQWTAEHSWPVNYPVVLGHEFAGVVVELGDRVRGWREGDRGVSETAAVIDLDSPLTRQGLYNLDPTRKGFGYGVNGAMTRYVRVPARCLHHLPDHLPFEKAGLTGPDWPVVRGGSPAAGGGGGGGGAGARPGPPGGRRAVWLCFDCRRIGSLGEARRRAGR
jgi:alcohol dehydrogenase/L-iditol 2-dehydrogenase